MTDWFSRDSERTRKQRILAALSSREREALERFYDLGEDISEIARDLGMTKRQLRDLKMRVKRAFLAGDRPQ
jgi:DNA-directed RNA polymerase specialized sigma24 family protein